MYVCVCVCVYVCETTQAQPGIIIMEPNGSWLWWHYITVVSGARTGLEFHLEAMELGWLWQRVAVAMVHYGL